MKTIKIKHYEPIHYQIGQNGIYPVMDCITPDEQKEIEREGLFTIDEFIQMNKQCFTNQLY